MIVKTGKYGRNYLHSRHNWSLGRRKVLKNGTEPFESQDTAGRPMLVVYRSIK